MPNYIEIRIPGSNTPLFDDLSAGVLLIERTATRHWQLRALISYHPTQTAQGVIQDFLAASGPNPSVDDFDRFLHDQLEEGLRRDITQRRAQAQDRRELEEARKGMVPYFGRRQKTAR